MSEVDPLVILNQCTNAVEVSSRIVYKDRDRSRNYHDWGDTDDKGYIDYYDEYQDRHVFVTGQDVGKSQSFHDDFEIQAIWNVISPCSNHDHSSNMSKKRKLWFLTNIRHVCLQMFNTEGNIAIFCNSGRSRSPMYLVAYLTLFCHLTFDNAFRLVEVTMLNSRDQVLDRHCSLHDIVALINNII